MGVLLSSNGTRLLGGGVVATRDPSTEQRAGEVRSRTKGRAKSIMVGMTCGGCDTQDRRAFLYCRETGRTICAKLE